MNAPRESMEESRVARDEALRIEREMRLNDPRLLNSTVAVVLERDGRPWQHGTGTLFRFGHLSFLVTAGHVVRAADQYSLYLVGASERCIPLKGQRIYTSGEQDDLFDLAIWKLEDETIEGLGACTYLRQIDVSPADDLGPDDYFLTGFPTENADTDHERGGVQGLGRLTFFTSIFDGDASGLPNYRSDCHLLLSCSDDKISLNEAAFPAKLNGISGCAVWRSFASGPQRRWQAGRARIVGVQTSTYRNHSIIKATRWNNVGKILYEKFPELRGSLNLLFPTKPS